MPGAGMKPSALYLALGRACQSRLWAVRVSQPQPWSASSQFRKTHGVCYGLVALCVFGDRVASYIVQEMQVSSCVVFGWWESQRKDPFLGQPGEGLGGGYSVPRNSIPDKLGQRYSCVQGNLPSPPSRGWEPGTQLEGRPWRHASCDFSLRSLVLISVSRHIPRPSPCVV